MSRLEGISYRTEEGEGVPLVFIHGWLCSKETWNPIARELEINNPKVFYDQRCHGESTCSKFDFDILAEDLKAVIEELGLENPILVGDSMGGMVALTYAVKNNEYSGLFLTGTCASTPEPENHSPRFFLEKFGSMDRRAWAIEIVENYASDSGNEKAKDMARRALIEAGDTEIIYSLGSMISYDVRDELEEVDAPSKVIAGKKDGAVTPEKAEELAELLDGKLHEIDASHLMFQEKPGKIAELLSEFARNSFD